MKSRHSVFGLSAGLLVCALGVSGTAHAQEAEGAAPTPAANGEAATGAAPAEGEAAAAAPEAEATSTVAPPPATVASAPPAADTTTSTLSVEVLPGTAYPEQRTRGIQFGSLWLTMHGQQWPYLPAIDGKPGLRFGVSGSAWVDTSYARLELRGPNDTPVKRWTNQGRAVLRASPTYNTGDGWFVQGQVEFVANSDQYLAGSQNIGGIDDLYVRVGKWRMFDVTVGRFQGWEVYHYGMGLDLNTLERTGADSRNSPIKAPQIYGVSNYWDRPNSASGNIAAHVYISDLLRLELLGQVGNLSGFNNRAIRPVAVLDLGIIKAKVGFEWGKQDKIEDGSKQYNTSNGLGGALQLVLNPYVEAGVNGAIGYYDSVNASGLLDERGSTTTKSFGGFANARVIGPLVVGAGVNVTNQENLEVNKRSDDPNGNFGKRSDWNHLQAFGAVQYTFWDRFYIKFVGAYSTFDHTDRINLNPVIFTNKMYGGRLRLMYLF